jgi:hypothetical protein
MKRILDIILDAVLTTLAAFVVMALICASAFSISMGWHAAGEIYRLKNDIKVMERCQEILNGD